MVSIPDQSYSAKFGEYFSQQINGGDGVYTLYSGNLPEGLSLSSTGLISGTLGNLNSWEFVVKAGQDFGGYSYGNISIIGTLGTPIIVENQTLYGFYESEFSGIIIGHLPSYGPKKFLLEDEGNRQVTSWQITGLPSWATLNSTTGAITGIPTARGTHPVTINVSGQGGTDSTTGTIFIDYGWPILAAGQNLHGKVGELFSQTPALSDEVDRPATSWAITSGTLPSGLTLNTTTGAITGTPTAKVSRTVSLRVSGGGGAGAITSVTFTISDGAPIITPGQTFQGRVGVAFSGTPALTDSTNRPATSWAATSLPAGLSINTTTGAITGTPTQEGSSTATITAAGPGGTDTETVIFSVVDNFPIFRGATRATAVYAGATEGKAIYYGPSLLWNAAGWEPSTLQNNLLAFYRLNDDGSGALSLADSSGNNRTLTNANAAALSSGAIQGSALFTGNSQFLTAGIPFNPAQPYSISMWVNVSTLKNYFSIIAGSTGGTLNIHGDSSGGLSWNNGASGDFSQSGFFSANQWMHCVFVRGSANAMTVYKNGTLVKTATGSTNYSPITLVDIGNVRHMFGFQFAGKIDAIGIWDRALTTTEIGKLYNSGTGFEF